MNGIIVPTHPKDFHWTENLLKSAGPEENIVVVFSSEADQAAFKMPCRSLVTPPKPDNIESWPTYKKLYGLTQLHDEFDYLCTIDTETKLIKPVCPHLEEIWNANCFVANKSKYGHIVMDSCLQDLGLSEYGYPRDIFIWFNELQVYQTKLIPEFMDWLPKHISVNSFDYVLFSIFMVMKHNQKFRMLSGLATFSVIEEIAHNKFRDVEEVRKVNWSVPFKGMEKYDNIRAVYHLDREVKLDKMGRPIK